MAETCEKNFEWNDIYDGEESDYLEPDAAMLNRIDTLEPGRALDVGCGAGGLLVALARRGWQASGVDIAPKAIAAAKKVLASRGLSAEVSVGDSSKWQPEGRFDLITNSFALPDTLSAQAALFETIREALAPGGVVLIKDFESAMTQYPQFQGFHCPTVAELGSAFEGFEILQADVVDTPAHKHGKESAESDIEWKAVLFCARRPSA